MRRKSLFLALLVFSPPAWAQHPDVRELVRRLEDRDSRVWSEAMDLLSAAGARAVTPL